MADDPVLRNVADTDTKDVEPADGLHKTVLVNETDGAPNVALRRFRLEPGGSVPEHTNAVEHEQYVLAGEYVVGLEDTEHRVGSGDVVHIPAETAHWYRNESDQPGVFICAVPTGEDTIQLVE